MWIHPNIVESQQSKAKTSSNNVVGISIRETEEDVASLTSSGEEESAFATDIGALSMSKTRSDKQYWKQYNEPIASSPIQSRRQSSSLRSNRGQIEGAS